MRWNKDLRFALCVVLIQSGYLQPWHFTGPDVAKNQTASQGPETFLDYYAELAVDGVVDTNIEHNHCSHTGSSPRAWWSVELGHSYVVKGIRIYNRSNNLGRLQYFRILGYPGNVEIYNDGAVPNPLYLHEVIEIQVTAATQFTEIEVTVPGPYLTLCEVEIYAELCELPQVPLHLNYRHTGDVIYDDYVIFGTELTFYCEPKLEYGLIGLDVVTCLVNGNYSDPFPRCMRFCHGPPAVESGNYTDMKSSFLPGDFLWTTCDANNAPRTDTKVLCTDNSTWSPENPACSEVACSSPGQFAHGHYVLNSSSVFPTDGVDVGTNITVVCDTEGYVPICSTRTCTVTGAWTGEGECQNNQTIKCSLQSLRPDQRFYVLNETYGSFIGYNSSIHAHCKYGYTIASGDVSRTCLANGSLSGTELLCSVVTCSCATLKPKERFYVLGDIYGDVVQCNDTIQTSCKSSYFRLTGDLVRTCDIDGAFSGDELLCSSNKCSLESLQPEVGFYYLEENYGSFVSHNTTLHSACIPNYVRRGGDYYRTCREDGAFSGTELNCSLIECSLQMLDPEDHHYVLDENYTTTIQFNDTISASCIPAYTVTAGDANRTCRGDGDLSGAELLCSDPMSKCGVTVNPVNCFLQLAETAPTFRDQGVPKWAVGVMVPGAFVLGALPVLVIYCRRLRRRKGYDTMDNGNDECGSRPRRIN